MALQDGVGQQRLGIKMEQDRIKGYEETLVIFNLLLLVHGLLLEEQKLMLKIILPMQMTHHGLMKQH